MYTAREANQARQRQCFESEAPEERRERIASETAEQRETRLAADRARRRRRITSESAELREIRLARRRARNAEQASQEREARGARPRGSMQQRRALEGTLQHPTQAYTKDSNTNHFSFHITKYGSRDWHGG